VDDDEEDEEEYDHEEQQDEEPQSPKTSGKAMKTFISKYSNKIEEKELSNLYKALEGKIEKLFGR